MPHPENVTKKTISPEEQPTRGQGINTFLPVFHTLCPRAASPGLLLSHTLNRPTHGCSILQGT